MFFAAAAVAPPHTPWEWCVAILQIVLIDVVLAGDNAVVIALAVRKLEPRQRLIGILLGSGAAVVLRVGLTFVATQLLAIPFIKFAGGAVVIWIALKLLKENTGGAGAHDKDVNGLWSAVWMILIADITMSIDNVLAVAGAAKGSFGLLLFGLGLSIPLVVGASNLLSKMMDRYPLIVWIGSAILGKVGGEMIVTDPLVANWLNPGPLVVHGAGIVGAGAIVGVGLLAKKRRRKS